jgi:Flp pilus assembly protein TadD
MMWFWRDASPVLKRDAGPLQRLLGAGGVIWFYLYKALWPSNLIFVYPAWRIDPRSVLWWLPLLAAIIASTGLWRFRDSWTRPLAFAWFFFLIGLFPIMGFFDVYFMQYSLVADHYQHMAIAAPVALAAAGWTRWHVGNRTAANITAALVVGVLMYLTFQQGRIYKDAETLYRATLEKNPDCWMAHNNLGAILVDTGRAQDGMSHYQEAMHLNPRDPQPHNNLGNVLMQQGRFGEAIAEYEKALQLDPKNSAACNNLAWLYATAGDPKFRDGDKAVQFAERAVAIAGNTDSRIQDTPAAAYAEAGRFDDAVAIASRAIELATAEGQVGLVKEIQGRLASYRTLRGAAHTATQPTESTTR